jgi:hypothetical protein
MLLFVFSIFHFSAIARAKKHLIICSVKFDLIIDYIDLNFTGRCLSDASLVYSNTNTSTSNDFMHWTKQLG